MSISLTHHYQLVCVLQSIKQSSWLKYHFIVHSFGSKNFCKLFNMCYFKTSPTGFYVVEMVVSRKTISMASNHHKEHHMLLNLFFKNHVRHIEYVFRLSQSRRQTFQDTSTRAGMCFVQPSRFSTVNLDLETWCEDGCDET